MTRIDFYSEIGDKVAYACRLARKAYAARCRVVLFSADAGQSAALDEALWTFSELDFLPHVRADDPLAGQTPILLVDRDDQELPHHQVLVNLSGVLPKNFARFERMCELVSADDADRAAGRDRYRYYQQRGYPLSHFVAGQS